MARKIQFGQRWWAQQWRDALLGTEGSDPRRRQRGRSYASKGAVIGMALTSDGATSTVRGKEDRVYEQHIAFEPWMPAQQQRARDLLTGNLLWQTALGQNDLRPAYVQALLREGIHLLPTEDEAMDLECTCPDSAAPCKHTAAAVYLLAQHLDRQPSLLLQWRGLAPESLLIEPPLLRATELMTDQSPNSTPFAISEPSPPPTTTRPLPTAWLAGLAPSHLFYIEGDLHERLEQVYDRLAQEVVQHPQQLLGERSEPLHTYLQTAQQLPFTTPRADHLRLELELPEGQEPPQTPLYFIEDLVKLLKTTQVEDLAAYPTSWQWLHGVYRWVQQLARQKAVLPRGVMTAEGIVLQWIPYDLDEAVAREQQAWADGCPSAITTLAGEGRHWRPVEAVRYWCHALVSYWVGRATTYWLSHARKCDRLVWYAWVGKEPVAFQTADTLTIPHYWRTWLFPLRMTDQRWVPLLRVEQAGEGYLFSLKANDRRRGAQAPLTWERWQAVASETEQAATLATVYVLSRYWQPLEQVLQQPESGTVFCSTALYEGAQARLFPLLRALGIEVVLPTAPNNMN